jgi:mannose-6-phosphate isomerase-like protein (cupin superfamily)
MPPGTAEVRHLHRQALQVFYVLSGELTIELDGGSQCLRAGEVLKVPRGVLHSVRNEMPTTTRFIAIAAPSAKGDRVRAPGSDRPR